MKAIEGTVTTLGQALESLPAMAVSESKTAVPHKAHQSETKPTIECIRRIMSEMKALHSTPHPAFDGTAKIPRLSHL